MTHQPPYLIVVDDDPDFLDLNRRMLEKAGYRVDSFSTVSSAIEAMRADAPDLIVTDLMMESLDSGFAFSEALKSDPELKDVPVIVVTAMTSQRGFDFRPHGEEDLAAMNIDAFFEKPVDYGKLLAKVGEILNRTGG